MNVLSFIADDMFTNSTFVMLTTKYSSTSAELSLTIFRGIVPILIPLLISIEVLVTTTSELTAASLSPEDNE